MMTEMVGWPRIAGSGGEATSLVAPCVRLQFEASGGVPFERRTGFCKDDRISGEILSSILRHAVPRQALESFSRFFVQSPAVRRMTLMDGFCINVLPAPERNRRGGAAKRAVVKWVNAQVRHSSGSCSSKDLAAEGCEQDNSPFG
jgi:hypothetical protein